MSRPAARRLRRPRALRPLRGALRGRGGAVSTLPLVAPSVVLLLVWSIVPLAMTLWFSFRRYNLLNPMIHGFAGLDNYRFLFQDPALISSLIVTVVLVGAVLVITVGLGAVLAAVFETGFPGRGDRARADDLAVLRDADGQRADLEEPADEPGERVVRLDRCAAWACRRSTGSRTCAADLHRR